MAKKLSLLIILTITFHLAINSCSTTSVESYKNGFPTWVIHNDRKLIQAKIPKSNIVVAQDGSGNYITVKAAIDAAATRSKSGRYVIYIKKGVYEENIKIEKNLNNIMFVGDGAKNTIITGNLSDRTGTPTFDTATALINGDGFIARGITFRNTAGPHNGQALALLSRSEKSVFYRCSFEGYQDTLCVHSNRQFYRQCYIYGTIDFIFGNAAAVFQDCMIYARLCLDGQVVTITAQGRSKPNDDTGIVIQGSRILAAPDLKPFLSSHKVYLGRPWKPYSRTVILESYIDSLVDPAGWLQWCGNLPPHTLYYGEYRNTGPGSSTSRRVKWRGYHAITNEPEASVFTVANFINGSGWLPDTGVPFDAGF